MLWDALLSTALYVCLACAAPVLGAHYQRREARENVHTTKPTFNDTTAAFAMPLALAGVVRVVVPASEAILARSMLVASHGQMATDSAPRRSECVTQQPARLIRAVEVYVAATTPRRDVVCERKAVTAEMWAICLRPDGKQILLKRVPPSRALRLLKHFRQGYCPMIGQKLLVVTQSPLHCALKFALKCTNTL